MCGIFGYIGHIEQELAENCLNRLRHRGPDDGAVWQNQGITLGHRRLSILDLSDHGKQPMSYANERYWITYNGEIFNFLEIRSDLEKKGHRFRSETDTEVILAAFLEWGEQCLLRFNGMCSFAIWDTVERTLFLARDRFGKKPLFYSFIHGDFAFASEMKAILPLLDKVVPNMALVTNKKRMHHYEATEECLIEGIKRFPAGHYGWYKNGHLTLTKWWDTLDHLVEVPKRYEDQLEQFRELFIDACRIRMRSDVPIGTALSGGLDSSSVISVMDYIAKNRRDSRISENYQHAFVASFPGTAIDETHYAKMVVDNLDIRATYINIDPSTVIDKMTEYFYLFEELYLTSPIPFMLTYKSVRENGVKVTMDGHGADELFGGYNFDFINALIDARYNRKHVSNILTAYFDDLQASDIGTKIRLIHRWRLSFAKTMVKRIIGRKRVDPRVRKMDYLNQILYESSHETILPTLLRNYDRYSMANGVEIRMPFMDYRIITYAFSLPWTSKVHNGFSKAIIRDSLKEFMPPEVTYRKSKLGFSSPMYEWLRGPLKEYFLDLIESEDFKHCPLIDAAEGARSLKSIIYATNPYEVDIERTWVNVAPYFWEQAFLKNKEV